MKMLPSFRAAWLLGLAFLVNLMPTLLRSQSTGPRKTIAVLNAELVWIEAGTFLMGSARGGSDARNVTQVTHTRGFWLGKTEVTQAQWQAIMGSNPSIFKGVDLPVDNVSWEDAMRFCRKLTDRERAAGRLGNDLEYTLPTEAQWEYACRAGTTEDLAGDLDAVAWYRNNSNDQTHPVATKAANAWGLHDMYGNIYEWCRDWYGEYPGGSVRDPVGASAGPWRVIRGGCWTNAAREPWSPSARLKERPSHHNNCYGFRLALSSAR